MPCGGSTTAGSLTAAQYTQTFTYDPLDRLTSSPLGGSVYGDAKHLHAATSVGASWTGTYDAAGNLTCRAPTSAATCSGTTPTGAQLTYDAAGQFVGWHSPTTGASGTDAFLYDGEGHRVEQVATSSGTTTTTTYVGDVEEVVSTQGSTPTTNTTLYYTFAGHRVAERVNGTLAYLTTDVLGSLSAALDGSGSVTASQLYAPYGGVRYSQGTLPTSYGFTGQRSDASTGLDAYGARYYDPIASQFASADTVLGGGLNRYAYVAGNPETSPDPTGHCPWCVAGAIIGAVAGAGIGYGVQVYNNFQHHAANPWGDNIDWGMVVAGGLAGALIGGTMGAGAAAAADVFAAGGSASVALQAGGSAAVTFAAYGIAPTTAAAVGDLESDVATTTAAATVEATTVEATTVEASTAATADAGAIASGAAAAQTNVETAEQLRLAAVNPEGKTAGAGGIVTDMNGNTLWQGTSQDDLDPDRVYTIANHPNGEFCTETKGACAAGAQLQSGKLAKGGVINVYYSQVRGKEPCAGCQQAMSLLAVDNEAPVIAYSRSGEWYRFNPDGTRATGRWR